jgi:hypothetical protein
MRAVVLSTLVVVLLGGSATAMEPLHHFREKPKESALFRDAAFGPASSAPLSEPEEWSQSLRRLTHRKRGATAMSIGSLVSQFASPGQDTKAALDAQEIARLLPTDRAIAVPLGAAGAIPKPKGLATR